MSVWKWLALDKLSNFIEIIKWNGGVRRSISQLYLRDSLKIGCLAGTDQYGNKYYENNYYFFGRNRWVEFNPEVGLHYDASMIPPEWFGWMHYRSDLVPCQDPSRPSYAWIKPHEMNMSGTPNEYVPYDTTRPKIDIWKPPTIKCPEVRCSQDTGAQNELC